jgi:cysteinyl-tRNA synthetase
MSEMELGVPFDIHGGGSDLIFPHHENEIAQSEAATGKPFAHYWLHGGMLNINAEKMSKSLGNFTLLKDVIDAYPAPVLRLLMLQTHYRSPLDFSTERLEEARTAYERFATLLRTIRWHRGRPATGAGAPDVDRDALTAAAADARARFLADMDDDFNSAGALGAIFELAHAANAFLSVNEAVFAPAELVALGEVEAAVVELLAVLGVKMPADESGPALPAGIVQLARDLAAFGGGDTAAAADAILTARAEARAAKDWPRADAIRDGLAALGVRVEDTPSGPRVTVSGS